jgi:uncharacterized OsmC-like protein
VEGDIGPADKTIKITEIRVTYHVRVPEDKKAEAERSLDFHSSRCPAYQSIKDSIPVKIDAEFEWV